MRRFLLLFFAFPVFLFSSRFFLAGLDLSLYILYGGIIIWGILLAIYFAKLPQKKNHE